MRELTFGVILPEGIPFRTQIFEAIRQCEFTIQDFEERILNCADISQLFHNRSARTVMAAENHLDDQKVIVFTVQGEEATETLIQLCGRDDCPAQCYEGTIRQVLFGDTSPELVAGITRYYRNGLIVARNEVEAQRLINHFYPNIQFITSSVEEPSEEVVP